MTDINVDLDSILNEHGVIPRSIYDHRRMKKAMTAAIRADRGQRSTLIKAELSGLKNRLQNYNDGSYGKARIPMSVELKKIEAIQALLDEMEGWE